MKKNYKQLTLKNFHLYRGNLLGFILQLPMINLVIQMINPVIPITNLIFPMINLVFQITNSVFPMINLVLPIANLVFQIANQILPMIIPVLPVIILEHPIIIR